MLYHDCSSARNYAGDKFGGKPEGQIVRRDRSRKSRAVRIKVKGAADAVDISNSHGEIREWFSI